MKYNVGDKVRIKSIDWYNKNKNKDGIVEFSTHVFFPGMSQFCGKVVTIQDVFEDNYENVDYYIYLMEEIDYDWTDEMIEGLVDSIEDRMKELRKMCTISLTDSNYTDKVEVLLNDYEYVEEDGKVYFVKKKKEYPKTYAECCKILGFLNVDLCFNADYRSFDASKEQWKKLGLMNQFYQLLVCRDAYWKIAGEEMGLGKPWEPNWNDTSIKYCLERDFDAINKNVSNHKGHTFAFPTPEMRDAFKENFDPDIEICKEFL